MKLDFVIIGAQKSGSTYVQRQVAAHPGAYTPYGETPFFQDPDYNEAGYDQLINDLAKSAGDRKIGVKRPNYFPSPEVPERILRHAPDARLLVVLRDPRERIVSAYFHLMRHTLPVAPLDAGLRSLLDDQIDETQWPIAKTVLTFGNYGQHLEMWRRFFPAEQLLVIFLQDVKRDPEETLRRCYEHLGLEVRPPVQFPRRPMEGVYSMTRQRWNHAIARLEYVYSDDRRRIHKNPNLLIRSLGLSLRGVDQTLLARMFPAKPPALPKDLMQRLTEYYEPDVRLLESLTGRDLIEWRT